MKSETMVVDQLSRSVGVPIPSTAPFGGPVERVYLSPGSLEERIANRIRQYWEERGYYVDIAVRDIAYRRDNNNNASYRAARSDLMNGLPIGYNELALGTCMYAKPEKYRRGDK